MRSRLNLRSVIVFGSRARGDHWENSDINLLAISDDFLESWPGIPALEPFGVTPAECEGPGWLLLWDALYQAREKLFVRIHSVDLTPAAGGWREKREYPGGHGGCEQSEVSRTVAGQLPGARTRLASILSIRPEVVQGICGGILPNWWKPLHPEILKVFDAARGPRDATRDLENFFLAAELVPTVSILPSTVTRACFMQPSPAVTPTWSSDCWRAGWTPICAIAWASLPSTTSRSSRPSTAAPAGKWHRLF
ncbi:MAG: nucleotidyltransferase domain-containing protein [Candidatus Eremiobacteraeota bacterium]|nr:nucleotidyltransferase domain-containing protein [Candidatus Eremiobacteraeota bacterium]MCW5866184.1 nucleotidyltransferase domain-containing protein [Candidatus Eremiobacteraeota bacterium]